MCGIAGRVGLAPADRSETVRAMCALVVHRGPDSSGEYADQHAALGIQRLRVIDLVTGDQPQTNEDRSIWTVFNGEIYNFRELRADLSSRGHTFKSSSDTEVIVHLYEEHGERFVDHIDGMFAIAVWDSRARQLVLARDRLGKKPLLYWESQGELAFASEHRALLAGLPAMPAPDLSAIRLYLRLGYVPAPYDAFQGIRKLPPAHILVWREGGSRVLRYWTPPTANSLRMSEPEATREVRRLVERAVARRLVADVPIGAFLSGGVDSSVVVATMAAQTTRVRTFTIGFEEAEYSELPYARSIAERFGTEHHEFVVRQQELAILPLLVRHYGEPYADSSAVPTYHLARLTREHVTVALNGDGGDEVFAGYDRYVALGLSSALERVPAALRVPSLALARRLLPGSPTVPRAVRRARRLVAVAGLPPRERYLSWLSVFDPVDLRALLTPEFARETDDVERHPPLAGDGFGPDLVAAAQALDLLLYLPDDLLAKVDIASMANSLEVRSPLLDRELVEFVGALPTDLKLRGTSRKRLFKRAFADVIPREHLERRKQGFGVPIGKWLRAELGAYAADLLLSDRARARGYFRPEGVERLLTEHQRQIADHGHRLWALLMLELWHRELLESPA